MYSQSRFDQQFTIITVPCYLFCTIDTQHTHTERNYYKQKLGPNIFMFDVSVRSRAQVKDSGGARRNSLVA